MALENNQPADAVYYFDKDLYGVIWLARYIYK